MEQVFISYPQLEDFCRKHHITKLAYFGSATRDDFRPDSDVDILVEFEPGFTPGLAFFSIEEELTQLIGRKVDLQTPRFLSKDIRRIVQNEAVTAYEQA